MNRVGKFLFRGAWVLVVYMLFARKGFNFAVELGAAALAIWALALITMSLLEKFSSAGAGREMKRLAQVAAGLTVLAGILERWDLVLNAMGVLAVAAVGLAVIVAFFGFLKIFTS